MSEFFDFLQQNRPQIGLVDRFDLSEIYDSDERIALRNLLLNPDSLDQIYGLSKNGLTKEDVRTMGGLDKPVVHSIALSSWTLEGVDYSIKTKITTDRAIGEPGKHSFTTPNESDNVIVFHGGLAAKKIEYNFLDENGELRTTTVPTSRESLFNASKNADGAYTSASYPSLFRIRRRSHIYDLRLAPKLLVEKGSIVESPTDTLKIPVYMSTSSNASPSVTNLQCYATKNSPLILPVRINGTRTITLARTTATSSSPAFVYGWELRRLSDLQLARSGSVQSSGNVTTVNISINVSGTICNGVDSLLYIYLDPAAVTKANFSNVGLTEQAGKDIGLVGFDNLEELNISSNNLSTLPVWLKTLNGKLNKLNIRDNAFWINGIVSYFDWQEPPTGVTGASSVDATPNITLTQVLGYSGWTNTGAIASYDGSYATAQDSAGILYKDSRKLAAAGSTTPTVNIANGFRPFTAITELNIGSTIKLVNPDFSVLFPNLKTLVIDSPGSAPRELYGLIPKMNNNKGIMSLNLSWHAGRVGGSIRYLGNTPTWTSAATSTVKDQFIGQFKFSSFNINNEGGTGWFGGICTDANDVGTSVPDITVDGLSKYSFVSTGTASEAWSGWLAELQSLDIYYRDIAFRIANGTGLTWNKLSSVQANYTGVYQTSNKVKYNPSVATGTETSTDVLQAIKLNSIEAYYAGWYGKLFSIQGAPELRTLQIGANNWEGYTLSTGEEYILPTNFATQATSTSSQKLSAIYLHTLFNSSSRNLEFRADDLKNLPLLTTFYLSDSYFTGKFPTVYTTTLNSSTVFNTWFNSCRFRDLSALGSDTTGRVGSIYGPSNGTGVGGSLLPNFKTSSSNTTLSYINLDSTLSSRYPTNWYETADRGKLIGSLVSGTAEENTPSVTWTSRNNDNTSNAISSKLYQSAPATFTINSAVLVGDRVFNGSVEIGVVTQIDRDNAFIYLDQPVSAQLTTATLTFRRSGQNIGEFFDNHTVLDQVYIQNAKITGTVPLFKACRNLRFVYLNNNLLTTYQTGALKNITGMSVSSTSTPKLRRFYLEGNALTAQSVRDIISEVHEIAAYFRTVNVRPSFIVNLLSTRYNSTTKEYQNWTQSEIFTQSSTTTNAAGETVTIPDQLETKFNQLGTGNTYSTVSILLF